MDVTKAIEYLPASVKLSVIDLKDVLMKNGKPGLRVTLDRLMADAEKEELRGCNHIVGVGLVAVHRCAPELQRSYFYVI